jgi:hypothetical protein
MAAGASRYSMGWRYDKEDKKFLYEQAVPFGLAKDSEIPDKVDPRGIWKIEDQGQIGSCAGFARTAVAEVLFDGPMKNDRHFAPMYAYLTAQKIDDLFGRDAGSTISGNMKAGERFGNCPDELFPYPRRYDTHIPAGCDQAAEKYQFRAHSPIGSVDELRRMLGSRYGVQIGVPWDDQMSAPRLERWDGPRGNWGGHSVSIGGYVDDWYLIKNSHSERFGDRGWAMWHARAVHNLMNYRHTEFFAASDMENPEPREWDYDNDLWLGN